MQQAANARGAQYRPLHSPVDSGELPQGRIHVRVAERFPQIKDDVSLGSGSMKETERHDLHGSHHFTAPSSPTSCDPAGHWLVQPR